MKESRVNKFKQYRDSISKEGSEVFSSPSKSEKVSEQMRLFLLLNRKKTVSNILLIMIALAIIILLTIYGVILF
jgi:hypothetical protein